MNSRTRAITLLAVLGFVAFLLWSTLSSQRVECAVTIDFRGRAGNGAASAATESNAVREALTAACGPVTGSMDERIACASQPPLTRHCRSL
jgi:hypothetical protein